MFWFVSAILLSDFFHLICHKPVFIPVNKGLHHKFIMVYHEESQCI